VQTLNNKDDLTNFLRVEALRQPMAAGHAAKMMQIQRQVMFSDDQP
jgi:hypothetical protein